MILDKDLQKVASFEDQSRRLIVGTGDLLA